MGGIGKFLGLTVNPPIEQLRGPEASRKPEAPVFGGETGGVAGINGELTPNYAATDSTYTNGLGHSKHTFMAMF